MPIKKLLILNKNRKVKTMGKMKKEKVLIAMSGGVDSSVAAYMMKKNGRECIGVTMKLCDGDYGSNEDRNVCSAARSGCLSIEKLEAMTAVCSVGLDMIVIPADTPDETISAIIADEAAIGMVNYKTTAVRVIPAIDVPDGEELDFGGLLGSGPVMKLRDKSSAGMINRGGRILAPLQSLKN